MFSNHGIHQTPISGKTFKDTMATNNFRTCYKLFKWMGGWKKNKIRQVKVLAITQSRFPA
jgi:hypothetical protein